MNISFKGVIPIVGSPNDLSVLNEKLSVIGKSNKFNYIAQDATELFENFSKQAKPVDLVSLVKEGKQVLFLVTGCDVRKVICSERGYTSLYGLADKIDHPIITLRNDLGIVLKKILELIIKK